MTVPETGPAAGIPVPRALAEQSLAVCREVAERLSSPAAVHDIVCRPGNVFPADPEVGALEPWHPWAPASLSNGHPGVAMLHLVLAEQEPLARQAAHDHLASAVATAVPGTNGLFGGYGSIAFTAAFASGTIGGYARLLAKIEPFVADRALSVIDRERARWQAGSLGVSWDAYDTILGLTGIGRAMLLAVDTGRPERLDVLRQILNFLVRLTEPVTVSGHLVPGWWTPPKGYLTKRDRDRYTHGDFNVGLAHGIAGPLALFSLALLHGVEVSGHQEAMWRIVDWLAQWQREDQAGPYWPTRVGWEEQVQADQGEAACLRHQPSWCYGTPGVARAVQVAGRALKDTALQRAAVAALRAVFCETQHSPDLEYTGICHGLAGLLQATWRVAADSGDPELTRQVPRLLAQLLAEYDPAAAFGFWDLASCAREPPERAGPPRRRLDIAGALTGAAGVALSLLTASGNLPGAEGNPCGWDAAFLLS